MSSAEPHDVFPSAGPIGPASMRSKAGQAATASSPLVPNAWVSASPIPQGLVPTRTPNVKTSRIASTDLGRSTFMS